jgi:two-component system C4-dicarboxylate transport response regulator DctD
MVTDIRMEGMDGLELMRFARGVDPEIPVILVTGHGDVAMAVAALKDGAFDFLAKPFSSELLSAAVGRALSARALVLDNRRLRLAAEEPGGDDLIGASEAISKLRTTVGQMAMIDLDVLVEGETGVGKELVARLLHKSSARALMPFEALRCSALGEAAAVELFGTEATEQGTGVLGRTAGGILFMDEIEALAAPVQTRLLAYLEARERDRTGDRAGVRIVAATRSNLEEEVREGRFREELFYRLGVLRLRIPPLRERREDIPLLFAQFVREALDRTRRKRFDLSAADRRKLLQYDWPGNAQELRSYAYSAVLNLSRTAHATVPAPAGLATRVASYERILIADALAQTGGSISGACRILGISRQTIYEKMAKHRLSREEFRKR